MKYSVEVEPCGECVCNGCKGCMAEGRCVAYSPLIPDTHSCGDDNRKCTGSCKENDKMTVKVEVNTKGNTNKRSLHLFIIRKLFDPKEVKMSHFYDEHTTFSFKLDKTVSNCKRIDEYATKFNVKVTLE